MDTPFLSVVIDDLGSLVNEANERNNADTLATFADQIVFADLIAENIRLNVAPGQPVSWGTPIQVLADIGNRGDIDVNKPFRITAYVDGKYLGHTSLDQLASNTTEAVSFNWVPTPGEHLLKVIADWPHSYIYESNEDNNRAELIVNEDILNLVLPNIVLQQLTFEPENGELAAGVPVLVTASIFNDSTVSLPVGSEVLMSVDGQIVARRAVGALAAGRFSAAMLAWTDPWTGTHEIEVSVDPGQLWYESNTSDNKLVVEKSFSI
jgi:subtilase family serine protease